MRKYEVAGQGKCLVRLLPLKNIAHPMPRILIYLLLFICFYMQSCSSAVQDGPIVPQPDTTTKSIAFNSSNDKWQDAGTRTTTSGLETLFKSFRTWGYKTTDNTQPSALQTVMDGYKVEYTQGTAGSTTTNTADWEYVGIQNPMLTSPQNIKYWDFSATSYRFFAYSPFNTQVHTTINTTPTASTATFTFPFDYSDQANAKSTPYASHLWLATPTSTTTSYGACVTLTFAPIIAKVRFRFTYPQSTQSVSISNIQFCDSRFMDNPSIADTPLHGSITATYPLTELPTSTLPTLSMVPASTAATGHLLLSIPYEEATDNIHILKDPSLYQKWYYVPPCANIPYEQGSYTIRALIGGKEVTATVPAQFMQWRAGYQYTYIFKLSDVGGNISFTDLQVEQWLPAPDIKNEEGKGTEDW